MSQFTDELQFAQQILDPDAYIERVKSAVRDEFSRIDDTAVLNDTHYFNHSAVPDFVLKWPDGSVRNLYLRNSYDSIVASNDAVRFNRARPVMLALRPPEIEESFELIAGQARNAPETLIADSAAFDAMTVPEAGSDVVSPIGDLIRSNLARGGRGLLTSDRVSSLLNVGADAALDSPGRPYIDLLSESFLPESVAQISKTAQIIQVALNEKFDLLERDSGLSLSEIRAVMPWLLSNPNVTRSPIFWKYVGERVQFSDLLQIADEIENQDLTFLIRPNLSNWSGKRAYIGTERVPTDNASKLEVKAREEGVWSILGRTLGVNFGAARLHLATSGTAIRSRGGSSAVLWPELAGALDGFSVSSVALKGLNRSIRVNAEDSPDVSQDIEDITHSVDDIYYVRTLGLSFPSAAEKDERATVEVDFDGSIVVADQAVLLSDLARAALKVLSYRTPVSDHLIEAVIGISQSAVQEQPALGQQDQADDD